MSSNQFEGTWRLITYEFRSADGKVIRPFGAKPIGVFTWDKGGNVAAQIMGSERQSFTSDDPIKTTPGEAVAAMRSYIAYFGHGSVDESGGRVTTHVTGSLFPNWTGGEQVRFFRFSGERLTLSTPPMPIAGTAFTGLLEWEKIE